MERPILFNAEMVNAILDGRKTQTRRVIKTKRELRVDDVWIYSQRANGIWHKWLPITFSPYGQPGDSLWVRETFFYEWPNDYPPDDMRDCRIVYRATEPDYIDDEMREASPSYKWSPSIHMPRWASRITLEVTGIRVERVQDITPEDTIAEGIDDDVMMVFYPQTPERRKEAAAEIAINRFRELWNSINAKRGYPWSAEDLLEGWSPSKPLHGNPWVWVIEFKHQ